MSIDTAHIQDLQREARELSWKHLGKNITFYVPGMFVCNGERGNYPAISITGPDCELQCKHCNGNLLDPMIHAMQPEHLLEKCRQLDAKGAAGCLISGGSSKCGTLPWERFIPVIAEVKKQTNLKVSVHTGFLDLDTARALEDAGVDQALFDVVGSQETYREIFNLDISLEKAEESLAALFEAGLKVVPHIVIGIHYGEIKGEPHALEMIKRYQPEMLVFVVMMPLRRTPLAGLERPLPEEVAAIIARARLDMPDTLMSLGCARPRSKRGQLIELAALDCGINRMALYSDEVVERAQAYGLEITYEKTCCSID